MADPTTPTTPTIDPSLTAQQLSALSEGAAIAGQQLGSMNDMATDARSIFNKFNDQLKDFGVSMSTASDLTEQQIQKFSLLATAAFGARESFEGFGDTKLLSTFSDQIQDLKDTLAGSPLAEQIGILGDSFKKMGADSSAVDKAAKGGLKSLIDFGNAFIKNADNALRLQNGFLELAASTGDLGRIYDEAGPHLNNINILLASQQKAITDSAGATNLSTKEVEQFYAAIGKVPGGLTSTVAGTKALGGNVSLLTATIQLATGTHRNFKDVVEDLSTAFNNYGLVGKDALLFTARMGELSNKYGVQLQDIRTELIRVSTAFRGFADTGDAANKMAESAAGILNDYVGALKETGVTGQYAVQILTNMTDKIKDMDIAKKAFYLLKLAVLVV